MTINRYKALAANTIILGLGQFGSKFLVIIMMRFYQAALGTEGYGEINNIVDTAVLLMSFATLSIGESIIRFGLDKAYDNKQVFSIGMRVTLIGVVGCMLYVPFMGMLSGLLPDNKVFGLLNDYSWLTVLYVATGSTKSSCALFVRSSGHVKLYAIDGILTTVMNILFNFLLLFGFKLGNVGYILSVVFADVCSIVFLFVAAKLKNQIILFGINKDMLRSMLRFSIPLIPTSVMWWITNLLSSFMLSEMMGFYESGIYKAASKFPSMISIFSGIFSQAWNMSAITENNSRTIAKFYTNVFNIFQSVVYVLSAGLLLVIKPLTILFSEPEFASSYTISPFIILSVAFTCFSTFMGSVYVASKKSVRSLVTSAIGAGLNVILNLILIHFWGLQGATIAGLISFLSIFVIRAADTRKIVRMDIKLPKMLINSVLLLAMCFVIFFVTEVPLYYGLLGGLFLVIVIINFKAGIDAVKMVLKKEAVE